MRGQQFADNNNNEPGRRILPALVVALAGLSAAACSAHTAGAPRLTTAELVAPPQGVFEFCIGRLEICGLAPDEDESGEGAAKASPSGKADDVFAMTDEELLAVAHAVNAQVNVAITYRSDRDQWDAEEAWVLPISEAQVNYGDCEDYALEKRQALLELGVPASRLALVTGWSRSTGMHAVLMLRMPDADYVLDNNSPYLLPAGETPYRWLSLQQGENLLQWARVTAPGQIRAGQDSSIATAAGLATREPI